MDQVKSRDITTSHVERRRKGGARWGGLRLSAVTVLSLLKIAVWSCAANLYGLEYREIAVFSELKGYPLCHLKQGLFSMWSHTSLYPVSTQGLSSSRPILCRLIPVYSVADLVWETFNFASRE